MRSLSLHFRPPVRSKKSPTIVTRMDHWARLLDEQRYFNVIECARVKGFTVMTRDTSGQSL